PSSPMPFAIAAITMPPETPASGLPRPPNRLGPPLPARPHPPTHEGAPPPSDLEIDRSLDAYTTPATPAVSEQNMNAIVRIPARLMPARRDASALPPIAETER